MKYQFMPMFWGDFLANTMHLTAQEAGAYLFLIAHAWEHGGKIAVEDLQRVARVSNHNWQKLRPRVAQFFDTLSVPNFWYSERVSLELTKAAEISNKRKDAAEQMHSKSKAKASDLHTGLHMQTPPHTTLQLQDRDASLGKGSEVPSLQVHVNYRDPGVKYRSPPRTKSDNVLEPLPDKIAAKHKGES